MQGVASHAYIYIPYPPPALSLHVHVQMPIYVHPYDSQYDTLLSALGSYSCPDAFQATVLTGPRSGPPNASDPSEDSIFRSRFAQVAATGKTTTFGYVYTL